MTTAPTIHISTLNSRLCGNSGIDIDQYQQILVFDAVEMFGDVISCANANIGAARAQDGTALTEAAQAAARTKGTYLAAHRASVPGRRGTFKAIDATRHDLLIAYRHVVHDQVEYRDLGADWARRPHPSTKPGAQCTSSKRSATTSTSSGSGRSSRERLMQQSGSACSA